MPYGASNVNNGVAWPFDMPNLWVSDPAAGLPQAVELDFGKARVFDTVLVAFDTDLDPQANLLPPFWKAATCATHWRLYARIASGWKMVYEERENYRRRRTARFPAVETAGVKLEILAANPGDQEGAARVYELRVYRSA